MNSDTALQALDRADSALHTLRAYVTMLERQVERVERERDDLQRQLKSHRQAMIQRVYQHTKEQNA